MRAAAIQLNSGGEIDRNVERAGIHVRAAADDGAELIALPEKWSLLGEGELLQERAELLEGMAITAARGWARELGVVILAGSVAERLPEGGLANTSLLIGPEGETLASYRKLHMFDVDVGGVSYRESRYERAGDEIVLGEAAGLKLGMTVCYDLRFPELFRILALRGAAAIAVPSAFTTHTGRDHWKVLLRARAIENQLFVIAPGQHGKAAPHYDFYGRSTIVDPWGTVLATVADGEGHLVADLDLETLARVRRELPSLANRRPDAYAWPDREGVLSNA